jgi:hypothetical protein
MVEGRRGQTGRRASQKGGERAYTGRLGKDRSPGESRHSSEPEIGFYRPKPKFPADRSRRKTNGSKKGLARRARRPIATAN